jgi:tRNA(Ile)-lysidine synthase
LRIMPVLRALNPAFSRTAAENSRRLREAEYLYDLALKQLRGDILSQDGPRHYLDVERLLHHFPAAATILYELLRPFNFHARQVKQMLDSLSRQPGALFYSHTHQLLIDRETIIIEPRISTWESAVFGIDPQAESVFLPDGQLSVAWKEGRPKELTHSPLRVALDADALRLPLRLRHWRPGDYFYPYGMGGKRQKLQDFFTNNKIPRLDKNRIWLLETDDHRICWVVGRRIDERFKITPQTERHVVLTFSPY